MPKSMTGFGGAQGGSLSVEIRTVNHRNRDVNLRLPGGSGECEAKLRALVAEKIGRGRVDISVTLKEVNGAGIGQVHPDVAERYVKSARQLAKRLKVEATIKIHQVMNWPGVVTVGRRSDSALTWEELKPVAVKALEAVDAMRRKEGQRLVKDLQGRVAVMARKLTQVEGRLGDIKKRVMDRLRARALELAKDITVMDAHRLEAEMAGLADRADVTEEVVRLKSHFRHWEDTLQSTQPVGRQLDFLVQEILREVNTLGSKVGDASIAHDVVAMKEILEQMREQAANLE